MSITQHTLRFKKPFTIAYESVTRADVVMVHVADADGHRGFGCAAPDQGVTGETVGAVSTALRTKLTPSFFLHPINDEPYYRRLIQRTFRQYPSAQSAVEEALMYLRAQYQNHVQLIEKTPPRKSCPLTVTIGIQPLVETLAEAALRVSQGFVSLKIKCGLNPKEDIEKIRSLRAALPAPTHLIIDANQGYTFPQAHMVMKALSHYRISCIEQPVSAHDISSMKALCSLKVIPVIADESATSLARARFLMKEGCADGINVKLMKCGGPTSATRMIQEVKKLGGLVMLGCMYESNVSITTAARMALSLPVDIVDLDSGHMDFKNDPVRGGACVRRGRLFIREPLSFTI
ncbi:dipeptide epimerase [Candidatus Uhrbacteria bacterium]|nr:dipeptide epimerase [Candidatus Uhrbacteria bacterium]